MGKKRKRKKDPGPNPDPERLILVETKEGDYYRTKRGLLTQASLNEGWQKSANSTKVSSPAAKRLIQRLREHLEGLETGRIQAHFGGMLKKALHRRGSADYGFFEGYEMQDNYPLSGLLEAPFRTERKNGTMAVHIPLDRHTVRRHNRLVSHFFFDLVLLWGNPLNEDGLRVDSVSSALYPFGTAQKRFCALSLDLPGKGEPWMALLKVSCLEGQELAVHPKHYGMKVVAVGGG